MPDIKEELPTIHKLQQDIKSIKALRLFMGKDKRQELKKIESNVANLIKQIELFNQNFSDSGWCAYDRIPLPLVERCNQLFRDDGIDEAEKELLRYYRVDVKAVPHWIKGGSEELALRYDFIKKAFEDHLAERYYASVPLFLIIADGAVNDFTKRQGFFGDGTDVNAWDCLVDCNDGLKKLKSIFCVGRNKTNTEPIYLPYRNGILHGRDLNYANEYVSAKSLALLFAIADWMNSKKSEVARQEKFEKEQEPVSWKEIFSKIQKNSNDKQEIEKWTPRNVVIGVTIPFSGSIEQYQDFPAVQAVIEMLDCWKNKNYGQLSNKMARLFLYEASEKKRASECRKLFGNKDLVSFQLKEIEERSCHLTRVLISLTWTTEGHNHCEDFEFGITYEGEKDNFEYPWNNNGEWKLVPWNIQGLYK